MGARRTTGPGDTLITARSDVVNLSPGRYQLATALDGKTGTWCKKRVSKYTEEERLERLRIRAREKYYIKKAKHARLYQFIESLPDDERELWNRPAPIL